MNKDIDLEVHGISPQKLEEILDTLGERMTIGESFGIYNFKGYSVDIAMPRKEKLRCCGHEDFDISVDPFIGTVGASKRRDFTMNALMQDVLTGEIVDHYAGTQDISWGIIRHVCNKTFGEDPLRVLRAAQLSARFNFSIALETIKLCSTMDLSNLSKERIKGELKKALLQAPRPSVFFEAVRQMDQLSFWFPALEVLIGVEQNPKHHAEGDVWTHTMMVLDEAAQYRDRIVNLFGLMLAAVTHDFGKTICTEIVNGEVHVYTDLIEETAEAQIKQLCDQPFTKDCRIAIMPDVHAGAGYVIGFTANLGDLVIPNLIGMGIGCGMLVVCLGKAEVNKARLDCIIHDHVPAGMNTHEAAAVSYHFGTYIVTTTSRTYPESSVALVRWVEEITSSRLMSTTTEIST